MQNVDWFEVYLIYKNIFDHLIYWLKHQCKLWKLIFPNFILSFKIMKLITQ